MKCPELGIHIDRASVKELQDVYPAMINSIFGVRGGQGWGFRTLTRETNPNDYNLLYNFFMPLGGPMFRLIYKLLTEPVKFEISVALLTKKMQQMLESNRYPSFYADLVNVDPFKRQISSISLSE
jgi:sphingomyelin phosphodiesterase 4